MGLSAKFGTWRGQCRLRLSYIQIASIRRADPRKARRFVVVCNGNICCSAFADVVARQCGVYSSSFGLSTASGKPAHAPVIAAAREIGIDLNDRRSMSIEDFDLVATICIW